MAKACSLPCMEIRADMEENPRRLTLSDLAGGLSDSDFRALLCDPTIRLFRNEAPDRFAGFIDWDDVAAIIDTQTFSESGFRLSRQGEGLASLMYRKGDRVDLARVLHFMEKGASLIITPANQYDRRMEALCEAISAATGEQVKTALVVTTGEGGALPLHFDPEDILIMQVEGSKRWLVYGPAVENPVLGMKRPPPPDEPVLAFDAMLSPGDVLYVPAGFWHRCENSSGRSLHCAVMIVPLSLPIAIGILLHDALSDPDKRRPLIRGRSATAAAAALTAELTDMIAGRPLEDMLARHLGRKAPPAGS